MTAIDCRRIALYVALAFLAIGPSRVSFARSFSFGEIEGESKLILNYGVAVRVEEPADALINGPVDPFELHPEQIQEGAGFTHTGLPTTINQDDGNRNFKKGSLVNNRINAIADLQFKYRNFGLVIGGDIFYDFVYHKTNDNNSPDTVNKSGPVNEFSKDARKYNGGIKARLLDSYVYGDWPIGDNMLLNVRLGNQLVAWGESLFLPGISGAQSTADATRAFTPGVEVKQILLPNNQVSASLVVGDRWQFMGYYKFEFKPTTIFPVGDFLSPTDSVGPGAEFSYGAGNPLFLDGCPGLLGALSSLCQLGGVGGTVFQAPRNILIPYAGEEKPDSEQFGVGAKWQATSLTSVGLYGLRYTDPNPSVIQHSGYPVIATFPTTLTTEIFNEPTPDYYYVTHFDKIDMYASSYSTVLGPVSLAGEISYRKGAAIAVQAEELGTINPVFTRGNAVQALLPLYVTNPHVYFDDFAVIGEAGYLRVVDVEPAQSQPGIKVIGNGDTLFFDKEAWGFQVLGLPTKRGIFPGWDLTLPISFGWMVKGNPSIPGSFGALFGEGDRRLSMTASFQYLQNFQVGLTYNMFFGDVDKSIGPSFIKQNPYTDRDNVALSIKYSL